MSVKKTIIIAAAIGLGLSTSARATGIILDTLGNGSDSGQPLASVTFSESFVADSTGIGELELELENTNATTGSIVITLRADNSNKPSGSVLDTIATVPTSAIPVGTETLFDFYNLPTAGLTANTKYWIEVSRNVGGQPLTDVFTTNAITQSDVAIASTTGGAVSDTDYSVNGGTGGTSRFLAMCISDNNSCDANNPLGAYSFNEALATPEPASLGLIGAGLIGLGWVRRRRRFAAAR